MSRRNQRPQHRATAWRPLRRIERIPPTPEHLAALREEATTRFGKSPEEMDAIMAEVIADDGYANDTYIVAVTRAADGSVRHLSVKRVDRAAEPFPWRDLQRIKSQLAGPEVEAVELFPAESRVVDTANQRWLWCLPPGERLPVGFDEGRHIATPEEAARVGAVQERHR